MRNKYWISAISFDIGIFTINLFSSIPQVPHSGVSSYEMAYHTQTYIYMQTFADALYKKRMTSMQPRKYRFLSLNY